MSVANRRSFLSLDFDVRFDAEQRRLILAHELAHHRRRDIAWNLAALVVVSFHWFNPLAHHAYRLYRLDQELACDADVVAGYPALRLPYGRPWPRQSGGANRARYARSARRRCSSDGSPPLRGSSPRHRGSRGSRWRRSRSRRCC